MTQYTWDTNSPLHHWIVDRMIDLHEMMAGYPDESIAEAVNELLRQASATWPDEVWPTTGPN